jgi:hypothetical protein
VKITPASPYSRDQRSRRATIIAVDARLVGEAYVAAG